MNLLGNHQTTPTDPLVLFALLCLAALLIGALCCLCADYKRKMNYQRERAENAEKEAEEWYQESLEYQILLQAIQEDLDVAAPHPDADLLPPASNGALMSFHQENAVCEGRR